MTVISGHHTYKSIWSGLILVTGEELVCKVENGNEHNNYTVAVMENGSVVEHVPLSECTWHLFEPQDLLATWPNLPLVYKSWCLFEEGFYSRQCGI